jgi:sialidase-1
MGAQNTQRPKMAGFRRAGQLGLTIEPTGAFPPSFVLSEGWLLPGSLESAVALLEREGWDGLAVDNEDLVPKRGTVIKRNAGSVPPWPPNDVPGPNATCQARVDGWCTQHCFDEIAGHMPSCGDGPMVARCSGAADHPGSAWRCYGVSTLSPDRARYVNGSCFCSMTAGIEAALAQCGEPKPPGPCGAVGPPGPPPPPSPGPQPAETWTVPFVGGTDGYSCFRIPSLLALPNGRRLLFAEGRKTGCLDGPFGDHIDVVMKVSTDSGKTFGELRKVHGESGPGTKPVWIGNPSPVLLNDPEHRGHVVLTCSRNNKHVLVLRSTSGGETWSTAVDISEQVVPVAWKYVATGPAAGIQLESGRLVVCCDHATGSSPDSRHISGASTSIRSHAMFSDDFGDHWNVSNALMNGDECSIASAPNGSLLMAMRQSTGNATLKRRQFSISDSQGRVWSTPNSAPFDFVGRSNDCEASMVRLPGSATLVISAPFDRAGGRANMTLHISPDSGSAGPGSSFPKYSQKFL